MDVSLDYIMWWDLPDLEVLETWVLFSRPIFTSFCLGLGLESQSLGLGTPESRDHGDSVLVTKN